MTESEELKLKNELYTILFQVAIKAHQKDTEEFAEYLKAQIELIDDLYKKAYKK